MKTQKNKNHLLIMLIFGMTIVPFIIAWGLKENPHLVSGQTNHGQLIKPVVTTERSDLSGYDQFSNDNLKELSGHWLIVNIIKGSECNNVCIEAMTKTKQLRLMLNKELTRTRRAVLVLKDVEPAVAGKWWQGDDTLLKIKPSKEFLQKLNSLPSGSLSDGMIFVMDPIGNLMMRYEPGFNPYDVKSDLLHLLRISQIG
ncbi:MAG: hypothetical protein ABL919_13920 [Methylococcales bacterium]|nr:hypothetical protein [Methylococcaceae bacterium]